MDSSSKIVDPTEVAEVVGRVRELQAGLTKAERDVLRAQAFPKRNRGRPAKADQEMKVELFRKYFVDQPPDVELLYFTIEEDTDIKLTCFTPKGGYPDPLDKLEVETNKRLMRKALKSLKRPWLPIGSGEGVKLSGPECGTDIVDSKLLRVKNAARSAGNTVQQITHRHLNEMPQAKKNVLLERSALLAQVTLLTGKKEPIKQLK